MTFQEQLGKIGGAVKRHAPELLTAVSVIGLGGTAYLSSKAGYKTGIHVVSEFSTRLDNAAEDEEVLPLSAKEIVKDTWKFYIPVFVVGTATAIAIIGSNRISANQKVALISAAAISERALSEYQQKVIESTSKPKERKIQDEVAQEQVNRNEEQLNKLVIEKDGDVLVIETHTENTFVSNAEKIRRAENEANRILNHDGYISLNVFLEKLGLPSSPAGEVVGWNNAKPLDVVIGAAVHNDQPVLTVGYLNPPSIKYLQDPW